jgi:Gram-negative bacterial TonB protein C-terminal
MPFLSLGLLKDEREEVGRTDAAVPNAGDENRPDAGASGKGSTLRPAQDQFSNAAIPGGILGLADSMPSNGRTGEGTRPYLSSDDSGLSDNIVHTARAAEALSDRNVRSTQAEPVSQLPEAIEELRQKFSNKELPGPVIWGERKGKSPTEYLTVADRKGVPTFGTFKSGYVPSRGLLYSTIVHEVGLFLFFLLFTYGLPMPRAQKLRTDSNIQDRVIYLPEVGGGTEGQKSPGGGVSKPQEASAAPAHASKGFAYPGSQAILSDPPRPNNAFQTVMRPLLVHPEPIQKLIPLPNVVQMAETRLPNDLIAPKPAMPKLRESPKAIKVKQDTSAHRDAKFQVPTDAPTLMAKSDMPKLPAAEAPLPQAPKIEPKQEDEKREIEKPSPKPLKVTTEKRAEKSDKQAAPLTPAQIARLEMHGKSLEPILSISAVQPTPGAPVPAGEARGKFAVAPGGTLNPNSLNPGKTNGTPSASPATGQENSKAANAATQVASNAGTGLGHNRSLGGGKGTGTDAGGGSAGVGIGTGNTSGAGAGGLGSGSGKGRGGIGKGAGSTPGRGAGTGSGAGSGSGTGSFPGITIQGGEDASNNDAPGFTVEPQAPYHMTVVSTASSGGGLEDFGVFDNERVFTVYIPMKRSPEADDPTWTLQYSLIDGKDVGGDPQVTPPSPVMREWPQVPEQLEKKYAQRQVVISAVVDKEGKISHVSVKQSPDAHVSDPIVQAFSKWVFRPALLNNQPVAVKILVGIPL